VTFDSKKYDLAFLYHCLRSVNLTKLANGVKPGLNRNDVYSIIFDFPPLPEQKRIVAILADVFDGIDAVIINTERNLANARRLAASAFLSIRSASGTDWVRTTIGDQVVLQRGFDITKKQQISGEVPVVSSSGIKSFHNLAMVKDPGVVIGRKGSLGTAFYLDRNFWPHDTTLWVKRFNQNKPKFVYYFFKNLDVDHLDTGAANPALNRNLVHPIKIDWPPAKEQKEIVARIDIISTNALHLEAIFQRKLAMLTELKQAILRKAFTGELNARPERILKLTAA
jgi:type I restriction enzyme S subunit